MSEVQTFNYLERNLELISYNQKLVQEIINHNHSNIPAEMTTTKSDDPNMIYCGLPIHDEIDPINEAEELFFQINNPDDKDNICIIVGLGLGYHFRKFSNCYKGNIIVFEPNPDILRATFEMVDFSTDLIKKNIFIVNSVPHVNQLLSKTFFWGAEVSVIYLTSYKKMYPQIIEAFEKSVEQAKTRLVEGPFKLNIGPGMWQKEGWKTLDCYIDADIKMDLRKCKPLPIADNAIEKVFSSHCIEHIEDIHFEYLIKELYRCMKPGALMRLACPDAEKAIEAYKKADIQWFDGMHTRGNLTERLLNTFVSYEAGSGGPQAPEEIVREKLNSLPLEDFVKWVTDMCDRNRPYIAHINGYFYEKLERQLKEAGFVDIKRSNYKGSADEELRGAEFDMHEMVSVYVECRKPE